MTYNPAIHHRRSIRLKGYDYSKEGAYFITICCDKFKCRFGSVIFDQKTQTAKMQLNEFGNIALEEWLSLEEQFESCWLSVFQIMPNHMHGIIILNDYDSCVEEDSESNINSNYKSKDSHIFSKVDIPDNLVPKAISRKGTIGEMVGAFKSRVANRSLEIFKSRNETMGKFWQRDFWDVIIRDEKSFDNISNYIINNPENWLKDKFYVR